MSSLTLFASFLTEPAFQSRVTAWTKTFHDVTESGTVNSIEAEPSGSVSNCGRQKAVSANSLRSVTGAVGAGATASALLTSQSPSPATAIGPAAGIASGASPITVTASAWYATPPGAPPTTPPL